MADNASSLYRALLIAQDYLTSFAASETFTDNLTTAFGSLLNTSTAAEFRQQWLTGDFSGISTIKVISSSDINSAFTPAAQTIYLSSEFLTANTDNPAAIATVLLEEIGHALNAQLTESNTGDEGEVFATLVQDVEPRISMQFEAIYENPGLLQEDHHDDFEEFQASSRWTSTATNGSGLQQGDPTTLTWSIVADGTFIPGFNGEPDANSDLVAFFNNIYGTTADWLPIFSSVFDRWSALSGVNYVFEANDDGAAFGSTVGLVGSRGDVRIGGHFIDGESGSNTLAYNFFPSNGEMVIDTSNFNFYSNTNNNSLSVRNTLAHELGHGLGLSHVESNNAKFLLEPFISTDFDGPQIDDILGLHRLYGDALESSTGNHNQSNDTIAAATNLGTVNSGMTVSIGTDASDSSTVVAANQTDFVSIDDNSDTDFYRFAIASPSAIDVILNPRGPSYNQGPQEGAQALFNAKALSNLSLAVFNSSGTLLRSVNNAAAGESESIAGLQLLSPGAYYVRVTGSANNVQLYDLSIAVNASSASNDNFADRFVLAGENTATTGSNIGFTGETGESSQSGVLHSAWWSWTASSTGQATLDTNGSNFNTFLSVFTGSSVNNLTTIGQNNNGGNGNQSQLSFTTVAGSTYQIAVDGVSSDQGNIALNLNFANNDSFANRLALSGQNTSVTGSNVGFTGEAGESAQSGTINSAWWSWTAAATGEVTVDTNGSNFDTFLSVFTGNAVNSLTSVGQDDDGGTNLQSLLTFSATAGTTYHIAVDGFSDNTGDITLNLAQNLEGIQRLGTGGSDQLIGGVGDDTLIGFGGNDVLFGANGGDLLRGGSGNDDISGSGGIDTLLGEGGQDTLAGGIGGDQLQGGSGNDSLRGEADNDTLQGQGGGDTLIGGSGDDSLVGASGSDLLQGGGDNDVLSGGGNNDVLAGQAGNDTLIGNSGLDILTGHAGHDLLQGGLANDELNGGNDNDTLEGQAGFDILLGGSGDDILVGGSNNDTLTGGTGADTFRFDSGFNRLGVDRITDFANGDVLQLSQSIFGLLGSAGSNIIASEFATVGSLAAAESSTAVIAYNSNDGRLYFNSNGAAAGLGSGGQFAQLDNTFDLKSNHIELIA
ncbi:Leukotoxin [Acaryochloris thomasi RCC1774]|uniref:Leukotoxin n=1 Tax=Acaryochloris thomasi RCC1774 TaxID=1764569 RepID=A0A2W1JPP9_9CYAN|nr:pre-peptidase C-terminal domain-containing protein [Acaryochloris thomasi]PZD73395.1 Leukotoxin [Acaryochloris thomasi RCC1774]